MQAQTPAPPRVSSFDSLAAAAAEARNRQDWPNAIRLTNQALELKPDWAEGWWTLGSIQFDRNDFAAAKAALTHLLTLSPDAGPALALRGIAEYQTGDYPEALGDIQRAIALGAANNAQNGLVLRYHEALLLTRNGRFDEAIASYTSFETQAKSDPGQRNPELLAAIGLAGLRVPLLPKEISPAQMEMYESAGKAIAASEIGDEDARDDFDDFFRRFPGVPWSHFLYGYFLLKSDSAGAIREWRAEVHIAPDNAIAAAALAWALMIADRAEEAQPYARKAESLDPGKAITQMVFGRALAEAGEFGRGFDHLDQALKLDSNYLEAHIALAKAYTLAGRTLDAQRERAYCLQATAAFGAAHD